MKKLSTAQEKALAFNHEWQVCPSFRIDSATLLSLEKRKLLECRVAAGRTAFGGSYNSSAFWWRKPKVKEEVKP